MIKITIKFTALNIITLAEYPCELDIDEVQTIDYGNFGNNRDRHFWPGLHKHATEIVRPLIMIRTRNRVLIAIDELKFMHYSVKQLPSEN